MAASTLARARPAPSLPKTVRVIHTGSSGAIVRIIAPVSGPLFAIKTARNPRVPAAQQAVARGLIAPYFGEHLPQVLFAGNRRGHDTLITECPTITTLADAATIRPGAAIAAWQGVVRRLVHVWEQSARPGYVSEQSTRNHHLRWQRGTEGLRHALRALGLAAQPTDAVVINGVAHDSLGTILDRLASVPVPHFRVACQGDPQPRNILLDDRQRWFLVDWEWAGLHQDWRMMVSHLIGWWYVDHILATTNGQAQVTAAGLALDYEPPSLTSLNHWIAPTTEAFHRLARDDQVERDLSALSRHTAMLLLREIPAAVQARRGHVVATLLGEALQLATPYTDEDPHPLLAPHRTAQAAIRSDG